MPLQDLSYITEFTTILTLVFSSCYQYPISCLKFVFIQPTTSVFTLEATCDPSDLHHLPTHISASQMTFVKLHNPLNVFNLIQLRHCVLHSCLLEVFTDITCRVKNIHVPH